MMRMPNADQVREIMGAVNPNSTVERKAANKAAKANYAAELQAQMRANEEAKQRDRAERMGLNRAPSYNNQGMPPPGPMGGMGGGGPPSPGGGGGMGGGGGSFGMPPQSFGGPPPQQQFGGLQPPYGPPIQAWGPPPPPPYQPPQYQAGPPPFQPPPFQPPGGSFGMPGSPGHSPPPNMFGGPPGGGYGPPPPNYGPPPPNYQNNFGGPPPQQQQQQQMPLLPGPIPPPGAPGANTMMRMEQQAKKANYAAELQAQMRANEERKAAEKAARMHEDMRKDAEMAAYAARGGGFGGGGRGGGGAPHRDAAGNIVADLAQMHRMGGGPGGPPPPGMNMGMNMGMGGGGGGMMNGGGPMGGMGGMGMGGPPMMGMGGGPMGGMGMGGPMSPGGGGGMGGPPGGPMGGPGGFMGGPGGPMEGGPGAPMPNFRFRSDNAYLTPNELNSKQQQARELQEALERQIQEKKMAKEMEKQRELAEIAREEARLRADNAALSAQQAAEAGGDKGGKDVVVDAWEKARLEAEEAKAKKFAAKRGGGAAAASPGAGGGGGWGEGPPFGPPGGEGGAGPPGPPPGPPPPPPPGQDEFFGQLAAAVGAQPPPPQQHMGGGRPGTPLVAEKVRQVAAAELAQVKQELAAEAAQLREVVAAQGQTVAALKSHADRMEAEAERAKEQVAAMRINMIRRSVEEPEHILRVMADYDRPVPVVPGAPSLMDIGLDLPPTGAALRRSAAPPPVYDMGAVVPLHANHTALMMDNAAASAINANAAAGAASGVGVTAGGGGARPPTMGLRTVNPLEASMAAESVFIYPNGREMGRYVNAAAAGAGGGGGGAAGAGGGGMGGRMTPPGLGLSQGAPPGGVPTMITSQSLETGPVPRTPPGLGLQSSALGAAVLGGPAAAGGGLHRQLSANARLRGAAAATPVDVDLVMHRNQDKLAMLKGMTDLAAGASAGASIEALDDFLARYASQRPGLPERTVTPVLRIHTPQVETITHGAAAPPTGAAAAPGAGGASGSPAAPVPLYSSRANSVGPLPMGGGRVLSAGSGPNRPGGSAAGSQPGTPGSSGAAAAAGLQRRNSFTGDRTLQEGVLSQLQTPPRSPAPGPTGAPGSAGVGSHGGGGGSRPVSGLRTASPLAGRPPIMPNTRYSNNGSTLGSANGGSRPGSSLVAQAAAKSPAVPGPPGSASAAGTPPRSALGHNVLEHGGSFTDGASEWPSYNPSRAATQHGPRPGADGAAVAASQLLSRSRSMSAASEGLGSRPPSVPPLPEDSLDAEMRKGLGSRPGTGQSGIVAAAAAAQGPHGAGGSRPASGQSALAAASAFPRSPILAGRLNRIGSAGGRPDITGSPSHVVS